LVSLTFVACTKEVTNDTPVTPEVPLTTGTANFSKYVALGNSLTAGYSDGALFKKGQENSYPSLLSKQFSEVGGGIFNVPFCGDDNLGGLILGGNPIQGTRLFFNGVGPTSVPGTPKTEVSVHLSGAFNNMGIPGAKSFHLLAPGYGNISGVSTGAANPYFVRFASSSTATVLADAVAQSPTFFSLWIGNNDVLSYATSGGIGVNQLGNTNPATYGGNDITDPTVFANVYGALVNGLTAGNAKGVVANIPYVTIIPYFTTVPYNPITASVLGNGNEATGQATIQALNAQLYGPLKQALTAFSAGDRINLLSATSPNPLLIKDESLADKSAQLTAAFTPTLGAATAALYGQIFGQARQATKNDLVLLTTRGVIGTAPTGIPAPLNKYGITYPLDDKHILIPTEISELKTATDAFNASIKSIAESKGLAFFDANATLSQVFNGGIRFGNYHLSSTYVTGGAFSLDGVHPSARGYALIANKFLEAINMKYGSTFRPVDLGNYPIQYPANL
jgi:lysophospholipase L1-like esterase